MRPHHTRRYSLPRRQGRSVRSKATPNQHKSYALCNPCKPAHASQLHSRLAAPPHSSSTTTRHSPLFRSSIPTTVGGLPQGTYAGPIPLSRSAATAGCCWGWDWRTDRMGTGCRDNHSGGGRRQHARYAEASLVMQCQPAARTGAGVLPRRGHAVGCWSTHAHGCNGLLGSRHARGHVARRNVSALMRCFAALR